MGKALMILLLSIASLCASAEVYRWTDANGVVHYTDRPPQHGATPAKLPPIQIVSPGMPLSDVLDEPATEPPTSPQIQVRILSPSAEQTYRSAERRVEIQLALDQPLPDGAGVLYTLDGTPQNAPIRQLSHVLDGVDRGSHLIGASVVDASGKLLGQANPVIIHMKPPMVNR